MLLELLILWWKLRNSNDEMFQLEDQGLSQEFQRVVNVDEIVFVFVVGKVKELRWSIISNRKVKAWARNYRKLLMLLELLILWGKLRNSYYETFQLEDQGRRQKVEEVIDVDGAGSLVAVVVFIAVAGQHAVGAEEDVLAAVLDHVLGPALPLCLGRGFNWKIGATFLNCYSVVFFNWWHYLHFKYQRIGVPSRHIMVRIDGHDLNCGQDEMKLL